MYSLEILILRYYTSDQKKPCIILVFLFCLSSSCVLYTKCCRFSLTFYLYYVKQTLSVKLIFFPFISQSDIVKYKHSDSDTGKYRSIWRHIMTFNTDKINDICSGGLHNVVWIIWARFCANWYMIISFWIRNLRWLLFLLKNSFNTFFSETTKPFENQIGWNVP